jgi:hypothetical protein
MNDYQIGNQIQGGHNRSKRRGPKNNNLPNNTNEINKNKNKGIFSKTNSVHF